jgi:DNA (cytosine-5)-methyltransferase 1
LWEFAGSTAEKYAQVGNAVPTRLGRVAGEVIASALDSIRQRLPLTKAPDHFRIVYVQSHVRTRQWFKGGETMVWADGGENGAVTYAPPRTRRKMHAIR